MAETAIAALDASRGETGSPEPSEEAIEAAAKAGRFAVTHDLKKALRAAYAVDRPASPAPRDEADDGECDPDLSAEDCEYGCPGRCELLGHWKDRAEHWCRCFFAEVERREQAEAALSEARAENQRLREALDDG